MIMILSVLIIIMIFGSADNDHGLGVVDNNHDIVSVDNDHDLEN